MIKYSLEVLPGIDLFIHDVQGNEKLVSNPDLEGTLVINFCTSGMCESIAGPSAGTLLKDGGISISRITPASKGGSEYYFPMGKYQGVELRIRPDDADRWSTVYAPGFSVSFTDIIGRTLGDKRVRFGKASLDGEHILGELYAESSGRSQTWVRLKIFELMMSLDQYITEWDQEYVPSERIQLARHLRDTVIGLRAGEFSLQRIAEKHRLSVSQMQRIFKSVYGQSVYQYYKQYRLEEAAYVLQNTDLSVEEVALLSGYQSASKFTAAFKTRFGTTPLSFRHRKVG